MISEKLIKRHKLSKTYKKCRLHEDIEIYKTAQYNVQNIIAEIKNNFLKANTQSVSIKLKTYQKLLKHLD